MAASLPSSKTSRSHGARGALERYVLYSTRSHTTMHINTYINTVPYTVPVVREEDALYYFLLLYCIIPSLYARRRPLRDTVIILIRALLRLRITGSMDSSSSSAIGGQYGAGAARRGVILRCVVCGISVAVIQVGPLDRKVPWEWNGDNSQQTS